MEETSRKDCSAMAGYKVLVIDDEDPIRDAIRFVLDEGGHEVSEAPDGVVGLDVLRLATEPLIVILDLMMPRLTGLRVIQAVGKDPDLARRCAIVVVSAARTFTIPELSKYVHGGYLAVLPKPFHIDDLLNCVEQAGRYLQSRMNAPHDPSDATE